MEAQPRTALHVVVPQTVLEGAGVKLKRSVATRTLDYVDPFLLFDHFGSNDPADYLAGFPMHPHRGIETVTYMLAGAVRHRDSIGNAGTILAGDVQWMTSGRGILHEEMPEGREGQMEGFQLWVNLPARSKMTRPRYQEILTGQIPEVLRADGTCIRVIAGFVDGVQGPVTEIVADPSYLDITVPAHVAFTHAVEAGHTALAYVFRGEGTLGGQAVSSPRLIVFGDGDCVQAQAGSQPFRFLLMSGKPLHEPIARYGPFVMNTSEEIAQALQDLRDGTFV